MNVKKYETVFGNEKLRVELSDLADQANGSVLVRYGETTVFATAVMSKNKKEGLDYFPLSVEYNEKFYAAGQILGSQFVRREGRPSDEAVLTGRLIDRTIRPLFNSKIRNEVQITVLALSADGQNDPDVISIFAASLALGLSNIPWDGPVGAVRIGHVDGQMVINPKYDQQDLAVSDIVVSGKENSINMMEAGTKEISENNVGEAMDLAVQEIAKVIEFQRTIIKEAGKEKTKIEIEELSADAVDLFNQNILTKLETAVYSNEKNAVRDMADEWMKLFIEKNPEGNKSLAGDLFEEKVEEIIQKNVLYAEDGKEKRPDGRSLDEIRSLYASTGLLPISHGSGVFFRGGTHVLSVVTLGGPKDAQRIEGMEVQEFKHFMHHYNFPPFSTGETGRMGSPGRREIGHGALVERALFAVIPEREHFPYTIRVVSESMASNGSTSMGSTCASTLALMDAGVPIKAPVAGIAMGILVDKNQKYKLLTDIQGMEDHYGGMDFKVTGTKNGITAIQLDCKLEGLTVPMLKEALAKSKNARTKVLETITAVIAEPREKLAPTAPAIIKVMINPSKIGEVIGPGGKVINSIIDKTGAEIDIEQDGTVLITGKNAESAQAAQKIVEGIVHEFEAGELATGPVTRLFEFGAMVEVSPGQEGLVHISELAETRTEKVTDVLNIGDVVTVRVIGIDEKGRINLSLKQAGDSYKPENNIRPSRPSRPPFRPRR